jgi:hypothetical protein
MRRLEKRGESPIWGNVIFTILNLIFFVLLLVFVSRSAGGAQVFEQSYAKEIALAINKAEPGTQIVFDISNGLEIAEDNGQSIEKIFIFSEEENSIVVSLTKGKGGYRMNYLNDYDIISEINRDELILTIK